MHEGVSGLYNMQILSKVSVDHPLTSSTAQNSAANIAETHLVCAAAVWDQLKLAAPSHGFTPSTQLSTNVLLHHEHGGGVVGKQKINIAWQVSMCPQVWCTCGFILLQVHWSNQASKTDPQLGSAIKKWAMLVYLLGIIFIAMLCLRVLILFYCRCEVRYRQHVKHRVAKEQYHTTYPVSS